MTTNKLKDELHLRALKAFVEAGSKGTICLETGSGKSKVAIDFIRSNENVKRVLITSPRTNLQKNWFDELVKWGFEPWRDGLWIIPSIENDKEGRGIHIDIANIQTAYKWEDKKYDLIIMDEIHTMMTPEYSRLLDNVKYTCLMGLTATHDVTAQNDKALYYEKYCPIIFEYYDSADDGLINKTRFFVVSHNLSDDDRIITRYKGKEYDRSEKGYYEYLTQRMKKGQELMMSVGSTDWFNDAAEWFWKGRGTREQKGAAAVYMNAIKARKNFLLNLPSTGKIAKRIAKGIREELPESKILVFSELTAQADIISKHTVHSHNSDKLNAKLIADFNEGTLRELGSCNSLTLGLNLTGATHAIMESYIGSATRSKQKKGRLDRLASDEHADMWIIKVPGTQGENWYKKMIKKFDLSEAVYLDSSYILSNAFDYKKSRIKTEIASSDS